MVTPRTPLLINNWKVKRKIQLLRKNGLYVELKAKIATKFQIKHELIKSLLFKGTQVSIEDDSDVSQLQDGESVEFHCTNNEDDYKYKFDSP